MLFPWPGTNSFAPTMHLAGAVLSSARRSSQAEQHPAQGTARHSLVGEKLELFHISFILNSTVQCSTVQCSAVQKYLKAPALLFVHCRLYSTSQSFSCSVYHDGTRSPSPKPSNSRQRRADMDRWLLRLCSSWYTPSLYSISTVPLLGGYQH